MNSVKEDVRSPLERLPDDVSIEDIQYHLYVIDKVQKGIESAERDGTLTQAEVEERLSKWLL